jgi:hypothetical protein
MQLTINPNDDINDVLRVVAALFDVHLDVVDTAEDEADANAQGGGEAVAQPASGLSEGAGSGQDATAGTEAEQAGVADQPAAEDPAAEETAGQQTAADETAGDENADQESADQETETPAQPEQPARGRRGRGTGRGGSRGASAPETRGQTGGRTRAQTGGPARGQGRRGRNAQADRAPVDTAAVRTWARENGYQVSDRGRLSSQLVEAYQAAQG